MTMEVVTDSRRNHYVFNTAIDDRETAFCSASIDQSKPVLITANQYTTDPVV